MSCPGSSESVAWRALTQPNCVAVVGASHRNPFAQRLVRNMAQLGFAGELLFVNPQRERVFDTVCYPSLDSLRRVPDCVAVSVPAASVLDVVGVGLRIGVRAFVVNSAGFAEAGPHGLSLQQELADLCRAAGARLIGPNCLGLVNVPAGVATFGAPLPLSLAPGRVGVVSQSGSSLVALLNAQRDVGFSTVVSSGNEAVCTAEDAIEHLLADADTRIIVAFIETLRQPRRFVDLARQARLAGKPIVALKVGASPRGAEAAFSHTASLTGEARVYAAVFRAAGVMQVFDLDELVETVELLAHAGVWPRSGRTALLGISGGELALAADIAASVSVELPTLATATLDALRQILQAPVAATIGNPLDVGASYRADVPLDVTCARCVAALGDDPSIDIVALAQDAQRSLNPEQVPLYRQLADGAASGAAQTAKPVIMFTNVSAGMHDDVVSGVRAAGLPLLQGARPALQAIRHLGWYAAALASIERPPAPHRADPSRFRQAAGAFARGTSRLGEIESKRILSSYGIPVSREVFADNVLDAVVAARSIGFPVVLKLVSPDIVHKSDVDGVRLSLKSEAEVEVAYTEILAAAARQRPSARIAGVLVAEQVAPGIELIVGVKQDRHFGPLVLVGLGGVLVEVLDLVAVGVLPLSANDARSLLGAFPGSAVLAGARGRPAADIVAVVEVLIRIGELAIDSAGVVAELDLNPLIVSEVGAGCTVVDARFVVTDP